MKDTIQCALDLVESLRRDLAMLETKFMLKCTALTEKSELLKANEIDNIGIDENLRNISAELDLSKQLHDEKNQVILDLKDSELGLQHLVNGMQEKIDKHEGLRHTLTVDKKLLEVHVISLEQSIRVYRRREADLDATKATIGKINDIHEKFLKKKKDS